MRLALVTVYDFQATWTDINGGPVPISAWKGECVYLTMFYSDCERVCVRKFNVLESIEKKLRDSSRSAEFVLVTLDPGNDTVKRLKQFHDSRRFGDNWHLLVGSQEQTDAFAHSLGLTTWPVDDHHMIHDFRIFVLDADGQIERTIEWGDKIADAY
jgi:protein SCO1/2